MITTAYGLSKSTLKALQQTPWLNLSKDEFNPEDVEPLGGKVEEVDITDQIIIDALPNNNTIELAGYLLEGRPPNPRYPLEEKKSKLPRKKRLLEDLKRNKGLDESYRPPLFMKLSCGEFARLDGKHRLGFLLYLQFPSAKVVVFDGLHFQSEYFDLHKVIEQEVQAKAQR